MKIVLFNKQETAGGGIGVFTKRLKDFLEKRGDQVFEIRYSNEPESKEFSRVPYIYADKNAFIFLPSIKTKKIIEDYLREIKPDIVYLPIGSSVFDLYIPRICKKLGISLMGVCHTDISRSTKTMTFVTSLPFRFYLPVAKSVDKLQVFSSELKDFYIRQGVKRSKIVVIPNGVDENKYSPGTSKFRDGRTVLFIGRLTWIKNPELLVKTFLKVADEKVRLVFMGKGDQMEGLKKKFSSKRVVFLGQINDEQKKIDVIRGSDVFVLPSLYEGMSLSLLEAMSSGLCCITTDVASHGEVLDGAGIVIPLKNLSKELPRALKRAIFDKKFSERMGIRARKRILKHYSENAVFSQISDEFARINI